MTTRNRCASLALALALGPLFACAPAEDEPATASNYRPVGDVADLMAGVVEPAAEVYWDAVGVIVDAEGEHQLAPQTDEDWLAVRAAAYTVAEAGNLLMMPERALDQSAWIAMSQSLVEVGQRALEAADARSLDGVFDMGAEMYYVCTNCHSTYASETLRPNDARTN
ncbi:MAG: hypothetical protein AB7T31_01990 [Gemmatimonadales bacterium]